MEKDCSHSKNVKDVSPTYVTKNEQQSSNSEENNQTCCDPNINQLRDLVESTDEATALVMNAIHNQDLNDVIFKALQRVKEYFFNSKMDEQKLAEFMFKMLTLNDNDKESDIKINSEAIDEMVNEVLKNEECHAEVEQFNSIIDMLVNEDAAKIIYKNLTTDKIDEMVEKLLGEDTKKLICEKLDSESLDDLLDKLINEKQNLNHNPDAKHPYFDEFIDKILGKDVEDFLKKKLEVLIKPSFKDDDDLANIVEVEEDD